MASRQTLNSQAENHQTTHPSEEVAPSPHKRRRWWIWLLILGVVGAAAWFLRAQAQKQSSSASAAARGRGSQPIAVSVAAAKNGNLPVYFTGIGTVEAYYTVTVHTRVDGQIMTVYFKEGQFVEKGEPLVEIDSRPYQVQLEQAQGQLIKDNAALKDAAVNLDRDTSLFASGIIPKQQLDTQNATVLQGKGAVEADQAAIDNAKLQLVYCHITAPISGRIGLRLVDPGNIVHAADANGLIVITQLQPIAVIFTLPQVQLTEVYRELRAHDRLPVDAYDPDDTSKITSGFLETIDNQIDTTTGTYKLKAVFNNQDHALFPNQFVNIHLLVTTKRNLTILPAAAVQRGPQGSYVYVVKGNTANIRAVKPGITEGNEIAIDGGVQPGEEVVTDGLDKLTDGSTVRVVGPAGKAAGALSGAKPASSGKPATTPNNASAPGQAPTRKHKSGGSQP
jgi:membrane fusion protein, multidrug efflux system